MSCFYKSTHLIISYYDEEKMNMISLPEWFGTNLGPGGRGLKYIKEKLDIIEGTNNFGERKC